MESWEDFEKREAALLKLLLLNKEPTIQGKVRIISGKAKNILIDIPRNTRVLTDRLKTTVFDLLGSDIANKNVLDLYAGSGSFGLEAISRGAESCTFVEASRGTEKILMDNIRKTGFLTETNIIRSKVEDFLPQAIGQELHFDIIILDPPYK